MRIYTKTGDSGQTGLLGGPRVSKEDTRVEAYGTVDELNSVLGVCLTVLGEPEVLELLTRIQNHLFDVGSELATPPEARRSAQQRKISVSPEQVEYLEQQIDRLEADLEPLKAFILPGGSAAAAHLHHARGVCRRAERRIVSLHQRTPVNPDLLKYLNRLSDLLFVLARWMNHQAGVEEPKWQTGE